MYSELLETKTQGRLFFSGNISLPFDTDWLLFSGEIHVVSVALKIKYFTGDDITLLYFTVDGMSCHIFS